MKIYGEPRDDLRSKTDNAGSISFPLSLVILNRVSHQSNNQSPRLDKNREPRPLRTTPHFQSAAILYFPIVDRPKTAPGLLKQIRRSRSNPIQALFLYSITRNNNSHRSVGSDSQISCRALASCNVRRFDLSRRPASRRITDVRETCER